MKKLFVLALLIVSGSMLAQKPMHHETKKQHHKKEFIKDLSAEQLATLKTKKMTLALDLNKDQQNKMYTLNLDQAKNRKQKIEARKKAMEKADGQKPELSSEEKFNRMNSQLDKKIALKNKAKSILTEEQFQKWERLQKHTKKKKRNHRMGE